MAERRETNAETTTNETDVFDPHFYIHILVGTGENVQGNNGLTRFRNDTQKRSLQIICRRSHHWILRTEKGDKIILFHLNLSFLMN